MKLNQHPQEQTENLLKGIIYIPQLCAEHAE
jgi:hypothetical protein